MTYQPILQVRDSDGNLIDILTIRGKSAWDLAKESGYSGTAQNLSEALSLISGGFYWEWQNGTNLGPSAVLHFGENSYNIAAIPVASDVQSGIITTTSQILAGNKTLKGSFYPTDTNIYDLGSSSVRWKNLYLGNQAQIQGNNKGYIIYGDEFTVDDIKESHQIGLWMGGGYNRGLFDFGSAGLKKLINSSSGQWLIYWNSNNNSIIQINNTISIRSMSSDNITLNFYPRYSTDGTSYTDSPRAFIKVYGKTSYGNDLILSSGNATVISSGDSAQSFYDNYLAEGMTYSGYEHLFLVSDKNFILHSYGGDRIISLTDDSLYLGDSSHRWKGIYSNYISNEGTLNTKNLFVQNPSSISGAGVTGHFHPSNNDTYYLGNSDYRWKYLYVNTINASGRITTSSSTYDSSPTFRPPILSVSYTSSSKENRIDNMYLDQSDTTLKMRVGTDSFTTYKIKATTSDKRLKTNINNSNIKALPILNSIPMRSFDWISTGKHQNLGFIADELEQVDINLVLAKDEDEIEDETHIVYKAIDTFYLQGCIVKGIQELSQKNQQLENTISELKTQIELLKLAIGG